MEAAKAGFVVPYLGALPAYREDGMPVGRVRLQVPGGANFYGLLDGDGIDEGNPEALAAHLDYNDAVYDRAAAAEDADLDGPPAGDKTVHDAVYDRAAAAEGAGLDGPLAGDEAVDGDSVAAVEGADLNGPLAGDKADHAAGNAINDLLQSEGIDDGHAEAGLDGVHAAMNDDDRVGVPVQERRGAAWVRGGGRAAVLLCALCAYHVVAGVIGSPVFRDLCVFVPGVEELAYGMAAAAWMVVVWLLALQRRQQQQ